jgi:hypothetical protein
VLNIIFHSTNNILLYRIIESLCEVVETAMPFILVIGMLLGIGLVFFILDVRYVSVTIVLMVLYSQFGCRS